MKRIIFAVGIFFTGCLDIDTATTDQSLEKVEIDPKDKIKCDSGNNDTCFQADANKGKCPDSEGKYSGTCMCTHCEGGNICETQADHDAHDENCKLKAAES